MLYNPILHPLLENRHMKQVEITHHSMLHILLYFFLFFSTLSFAKANEPPFLPADKAFSFTLQNINHNQDILVHWKIADGYHLYKNSIHIEAAPHSQTKIGAIQFPESIQEENILGNEATYRHEVSVVIPILLSNNGQVKLNISYQGCFEKKLCYPPITKTVSFQSAYHSQTNTWFFILTFFGAGILLAFTPCVLPMLPIISSLILGRKEKMSTYRAFLLILVYVISMSITYSIAGIAAAYAGSMIQADLQNPITLSLLAGLFIIFALSLFGLYHLRLPTWINRFVHKASGKSSSGNYGGAAIMGCLAALIVSPCISAPLLGALTFISSTGDRVLGGTALFVMGLGMGTPLLIAGTLGMKYLPKTGAWMESVKIFFGIVMLAMAIWILSRMLPTSLINGLYGLLCLGTAIYLFRKKNRFAKGVAFLVLLFSLGLAFTLFHNEKKITPFKIVTNLSELQQELILAKQAKKPIILDFYADWCTTCKEMDYTVFNVKNIEKLAAHFILLRADVTKNSKENHLLEKKYGVFAPPTILLLKPNGTLIQKMDAEAFQKYVEKF